MHWATTLLPPQHVSDALAAVGCAGATEAEATVQPNKMALYIQGLDGVYSATSTLKLITTLPAMSHCRSELDQMADFGVNEDDISLRVFTLILKSLSAPTGYVNLTLLDHWHA
jgi:hypothetical protein